MFPTMKSPGGRVALNDKESAALTPQADGSLTGGIHGYGRRFLSHRARVSEQGARSRVAAVTIDVLTDQPPTVSFAKPGRDTSVSAIEEVYVEAQAEDDFGIRDLELVYSVNGGRREDGEAVQRPQPAARSHGGAYLLPRGARRPAG